MDDRNPSTPLKRASPVRGYRLFGARATLKDALDLAARGELRRHLRWLRRDLGRGNLFCVPFELCFDAFAFGFGAAAWNRYRDLAEELMEDPSRRLEDTRYPAFMERVDALSAAAGSSRRATGSSKTPELASGGVLVRADERKRILLRGGTHRTAVLAALGYPFHWVRLDQDHHPTVHETDAERWPWVESGLLTLDEAKRLFQLYFEVDGRERAEAVFGVDAGPRAGELGC